ncbi:death-inducer obliterator 1 [Brachionichthys hirsutus]|uniref:death-inducer obliterator 1 n=1 Tax=Brachionichthys hirsutus TaxID=412623 RepID=UPI00360542FA
MTQATQQSCVSERATPTTRSLLEDLEWSAPSSPASEDSKPATDAPPGGCFDPSLWQDFGSAFHTAFSLLGGNEGLSLETSDSLAVPGVSEATDAIEVRPPQVVDETEVPDHLESTVDLEVLQSETPGVVGREEIDDVVLISSQEGDSDEMTLLQIKEQQESKGGKANTRTRGGKGGRGRAKGKGRGRGRGRRKGRGRGRAVDLLSSMADEDSNDVILVGPAEQQQSQEENVTYPQGAAETETSPAHCEMSPDRRSSTDCIYIESDLDQITDATTGQYDDAPEELEQEKDMKENVNGDDDKINRDYSSGSETQPYDPNALCCVCQQGHNERFVITCDSCRKGLHGSCAGISEVQGREMVRSGQEYVCPPCAIKKQSQPHPDPDPQSEPEPGIPECLTLNSSGEEEESEEDLQAVKEPVTVVEEVEEEASVKKPEPEPKAESEADASFPLCIGPSCSKKALPGSVYCGSDCILHHAAFTMKTLSVPEVPKCKTRAQSKAATASPTAKAQRPVRTSKRLSVKAVVEGDEKEVKEDDGGQEETAVPLAFDPSLTEVEGASPPSSSKFYTASNVDNKHESVADPAPLKPPPEETSTDAASSSQPAAEPDPPRSQPQEKLKEPERQPPAEANPAQSETPSQALASQSKSTSSPRHHETGAIMVTKTAYVIPKKQSVPQALSSQVSASVSASVSCQKPPSALTLLNETRNLPVPPAPSAPSSRPSQPNNQVRQSIQRSLNGILFKRVRDCDDLDVADSEVVKLVANIEMEMFDIFRNTDSKYMNKYRTIMFNLKDPKNKGLLCRVLHGEISPFRLARMSQKDMQATKVSEPIAKETTEEQKKSLPPVASKARPRQTSHTVAPPDILVCMLKDTTSEHKTHLFDVKCKICTGQILPGNGEEPAKKKQRVSETRDRYESSWKKSTRDETVISGSPAGDESSQFLAKQDIMWKGFLNMPTVTKFITKAYRVSGSAENIKMDLPNTIQIGGRILPETVWDYVSKLKTSVTKELCVIRFHPATEEEEVAYVSLFSYFSSRGRFGVVANSSRSIKDLYLVPLGAKESIPSMLQPLGAPGLEQKRPNILLGLAIVQKVKRPGTLHQEIEQNRPKVHMSKDPMWIPKPPVLYGSDKLEIFQPYDPMTPANTTPPSSPSSSSDSVNIPSILNSLRAKPPVSTSATVAATQSTSDKSPTTSSEGMPLQTILKSLFGNKQTDSVASSDRSSTTSTVTVKKLPACPQVSGPMMDPIVQQYGQKSKVKEIEEENDLDRPYDPEEEYGPAVTYGNVTPQNTERKKADDAAVSGWDDDVAYDPEDETIFADIQSGVVTKRPVLPEMSDSSSCPSSAKELDEIPASNSNPLQTSSQPGVMQDLPTGTVVVSAATLTEQQRMLEELNKQIEEQKRQLKVQEEALRQQREAVGMFMAQFTVSDSLTSPAQKSLPVSQLSSLQSGILQTEPRASESADKTSNIRDNVDGSNLDSQTVKLEDAIAIPNIKNDEAAVTEQDETQDIKDTDKYSSAGEVEDSDGVASAVRILRTHAAAKSEGSHQRGGVIVKGIGTEALRESHSDVLLHIPADVERERDTEEVRGIGPGIELKISPTDKVVIVKTILDADILMDIEDPHHLLVWKVQGLKVEDREDQCSLREGQEVLI